MSSRASRDYITKSSLLSGSGMPHSVGHIAKWLKADTDKFVSKTRLTMISVSNAVMNVMKNKKI